MNWNWMSALAEDIGVPEAELMEMTAMSRVGKREAEVVAPTPCTSFCTCCNG